MSRNIQEDRERLLITEWEKKLPCANCPISSICKYANVVKRVDYPKDIFDVTVTCKIRDNYSVSKSIEDESFEKAMNRGMC